MNLLFLFSLSFVYLPRILLIANHLSDFPALSRIFHFFRIVEVDVVFCIDLATKLIEFFVEIRTSIARVRTSSGSVWNFAECASSVCIQRGCSSVNDAECMSSLVCCESNTKITIAHFCALYTGQIFRDGVSKDVAFFRDTKDLLSVARHFKSALAMRRVLLP